MSVAAIVAASIQPSSGDASFQGRNGVLAFAGRDNAGYKVDTFTPAGRDVRTVFRAVEGGPAQFSAGGRRLLLTRNRARDNYRPSLWTLGLPRHRLRKLRVPGGDASWSPDGRKLVYVHRSEVWRARIDGTHRKRLTYTGDWKYAPRWSPGGGVIAYQGQSQDGSELRLISARTGQLIRVLSPRVKSFDFSPDGRYIAYALNRWLVRWSPTPECVAIEIRPVDGGDDGRTVGPCARDSEEIPRSLAWSPDGAQIAYVNTASPETEENPGEDPFDRVYVMPAAGGTPQLIYRAYGNVDEWVNGTISWQPRPRRR